MSAQQQAQLQNEPDLATRTRELDEIAKSISQLADVFKDLQVMVIDQGTILDSIEYNIEQTAVHVQEAVKELNVATQCVLFLFLFLILSSCCDGFSQFVSLTSSILTNQIDIRKIQAEGKQSFFFCLLYSASFWCSYSNPDGQIIPLPRPHQHLSRYHYNHRRHYL